MMGISTLDFIQLQFSANQTQFSQNFHSPFNFFSKIALHVFSELHMQSFSASDLNRMVYEVCMNFKQSRHEFLPKKRMKVLEKLSKKNFLNVLKYSNAI